MPNQLFRHWRTKPGRHTVTAPLSPQPQQSPKDAAATLPLNPTAVWSHPRHKERTNASTCPHASSMRDRLGVGEVHTAQRTPTAPACPHSRPWSRAPRVPESPSLTRPPGNFPGAQLVPSARPQRLGVLRHAAPLRPRPGSAQLCPAATCAPCGVRVAGGRRRSRCVGAGDAAGALQAGAAATWVLPPGFSAGAAARRRRAGGRRELGGEEGRRRAGVNPAWRGRDRRPLP